MLVTALRVTGVKGKQRLAATYAASAVDMEGASVARVAKQHGIPFAAIKAISDDVAFPMPPVNGFVNADGHFRALAFGSYVAVRPKWWLPAIRLAGNSRLAATNLAEALDHLIMQHTFLNTTEKSFRR